MATDQYRITLPVTQQQWHDYYDLRWRILREPWQQPRGSEKDALENSSFHCMAVNSNNHVVGVGRIQKNSVFEAQIRYMAVDKDHQRKGIGSEILDKLERQATHYAVTTIILDAREMYLPFYLRHGYTVIDDGHTLFGSIRHKRMCKYIKKPDITAAM